jgi:succinate dehydrogenase / fumarate reductase iron-sulfur subunit
MQITVRILRFNPETDAQPYFQAYSVECQPTDRVLDVLNRIKAQQDGSLTFRSSCEHGVCGSDAMMINGRNRLACKVLLQSLELNRPITLEPIRGLLVKRDLVVDMEPFFERYRSVKPYLINNEPPPTRERLQSPEDRARIDDTTKCILCAACTTSCPSFWANSQYLGPAALVNAHRFIFDNRDRAAEERLEILNQREGVWRCRTIFNCVAACPRNIKITQAIGDLKKKLMYEKM